ncbi:MAG: TIGR02117 family protein [Bacteroidota bacterium]
MINAIKKGAKILGLSLGLFLLIYFTLATLLSLMSTHPIEMEGEQNYEIFVATNGVHLDLIILKSDLNKELSNALSLTSSTKYAAFGWGDKGFYLNTPNWSDLTVATAIKALLLRSETAVHLTTYAKKRTDWHSILITEEQLALLLDYIYMTFEQSDDGEFIEIINSGYTNADTFYEAIGSYNLIITCNTWVNRGLKAAQIKTSIWSPFDKGVLWQVKKLN